MTLAQLRAQVRRRLHDPDATFFTDDDIDDALNAGYMELSDATEWFETWQTVDLVEDRPYYDLRTVLDRTVLSVGHAFNEQTNRWMTPTSIRDLDTDRQWENHTGEPERITLRGLWWLGYWPRVQADSGTVRQHYTALPDALEDDDDEPGFPDAFHDGLVEFAVAELWPHAGSVEWALLAWTAYLGHEARLRAHVQQRIGVPMTRGFGGDARD